MTRLGGQGVCGDLFVSIYCAQKVQRKLCLGEVTLCHCGATEELLVERYGDLGVLNADHGLLEGWLSNDSGGRSNLTPGQDLDPVVVRVKRKCNAAHHAISRLLLERHTLGDQDIAKSIHVINDEAKVAVAAWVRVTVVVLEVGVVFSAVDVGQTEH